jgi:EmrB/QacA subfamily drug resistance transporter
MKSLELAYPEFVAPFSFRSIALPLAALILGTFMAILDFTVVNVALPTLQRVFQVDLAATQWVITGYSLAQAAVIPLAGWLSDRYGARRIYVTALGLFALGSALCAAATSAPMLILFRVFQGLGGGMLQPIGTAILYGLAPPNRRGQVMGAFGVPILLAPALGPVFSGWLVQFADWRLIFLINVPVGVLAVLLGRWALPESPGRRDVGALDAPGIVLGPLGFAALSYGISQSTTAGWTGASTQAGIAIGIVALIAFTIRELTADQPLLDLRVFRGVHFSVGMVTQSVASAAMFGTLFLIPLFLQQVRGYGAFETGLATLPQAIVAAIFMPIGGRLFDQFGVRVPVISGMALVTAALWLMTGRDVTTTLTDLILPMAIWGAGMGLLIMPLNTHIISSAPVELVSRVTSLMGAVQAVVGTLAIASFATIVQSQTALHLAVGGSADVPTAMALAFGDTYRVAVVAGIAAIGLAFTLRQQSAAGRRFRRASSQQ